MKKTDRGLVIIFSHESFDEIDGAEAKPRHGTSKDVEKLSYTFSDLGFKIDLQENRTYKEIMYHISLGTSVTMYFSYVTEICSAWNFCLLSKEARCSYEVFDASPVFT
jgi:hypothetical protein